MIAERLRTHAIALVGWVWAAGYLATTRTDSMRLNWGDPWSDSNVQLSGRHFAESGFVANAFTPVLDVGRETAESLRYTHYPPLPDLVNGLEQRLFGPLDIAGYRILADLLSLGSVFFFYRWVRSLWGGATANVAALLLTTSLLWLQYADTIHHIPLYTFFGFAVLDLTSSWLESLRRALPWLAGVATFLCMMASYDYFFFVPILVAVTVWLKGERLRQGRGLAIATAVAGGLVLAVAVKFALVAWAVGPRTFASDLWFQLQERTTSRHSTEYLAGLGPILFGRSLRFFTPLVFVALGVQVFELGRRLLRSEPSTRGDDAPTPLWLLLAGAPFLVMFSQLFVEQYHPTLQLLPYYAIGVAAMVVAAWRRGGGARVVAGFALVFAVGWQSWQLSAFHKTFLERTDAIAVRNYLDAHDHRRVVLSNTMIDGPVRTYFDRHLLGVGSLRSEDVPLFMADFFDSQGDDPVFFVEFTDVEKTVFDKLLYASFSREHRWSWIANPAAHRSEWEPLVRERNAEMVAAFSAFATSVLDTGRMRIWRVDSAPLRAYRLRLLGDTPTRHVDFGERASNRYKLVGIRYSEKSSGPLGFAWTIRRQPGHLRFTMQGLLQVPTGPAIDTAVLRFCAPERPLRITMQLLSSMPDQHVDVLVGGHWLARWDVGTEWAAYVADVPGEDLDLSGVQELELRFSRVNEAKLGVALHSLDVDDAVPAR